MNTQDNDIHIFALTDCHQEARKLCCLFSGIIGMAPNKGKNTLICDGGDLFKGIYERDLCVKSYLNLRQQMPEAKIVLAVGNNDFGFSADSLKYLQQTSRIFNQANIHLLCANLFDTKTQKCPDWVDPYILLEINHKKVMVLAFCINQINLKKHGLYLANIAETFLRYTDTIKHIAPDALIILNHALVPNSHDLLAIAEENGIHIDLIVGGHEHAIIPPDNLHHIYYPQAYSRNMLVFNLLYEQSATPKLVFNGEISCKDCSILPDFEQPITIYEQSCGLNIPVAPSVLNLERQYANPSSIGSFITDLMQKAAHADMALLSTGFICHALRYEAGKTLTYYNIERAFSAETPLQTVVLHPAELKAVFNNALRYRYVLDNGNSYFLQASHNITVDCWKKADNLGEVKQIYINNEPLLDENGQPLHPQDSYLCAIDPYIGAGEHGFEVLKSLEKETLLKNNQLVKIKDLFLKGIKDAAEKYTPGSSYPAYKLHDLNSD